MNNLKKFEHSYIEAIKKIKNYSKHNNSDIALFTNYMLQIKVPSESFLPINFKHIFDCSENFANFLIFFEKSFFSKNISFPIINGEPKILFSPKDIPNLIETIQKEFQYPKETEFDRIIFLDNISKFVDEHSSYVVINNKKLFFHQAALYGIEQAIADLGEDYCPEWVLEYQQFN